MTSDSHRLWCRARTALIYRVSLASRGSCRAGPARWATLRRPVAAAAESPREFIVRSTSSTSRRAIPVGRMSCRPSEVVGSHPDADTLVTELTGTAPRSNDRRASALVRNPMSVTIRGDSARSKIPRRTMCSMPPDSRGPLPDEEFYVPCRASGVGSVFTTSQRDSVSCFSGITAAAHRPTPQPELPSTEYPGHRRNAIPVAEGGTASLVIAGARPLRAKRNMHCCWDIRRSSAPREEFAPSRMHTPPLPRPVGNGPGRIFRGTGIGLSALGIVQSDPLPTFRCTADVTHLISFLQSPTRAQFLQEQP